MNIQELSTRRDRAAEKKQRLVGQLEAAEADLKKLEEECRAKNIEPLDLDAYVSKLETKYEEKLQEFQTGIEEVEAKLSTYEGI